MTSPGVPTSLASPAAKPSIIWVMPRLRKNRQFDPDTESTGRDQRQTRQSRKNQLPPDFIALSETGSLSVVIIQHFVRLRGGFDEEHARV
jgi:hypothetical protein